MDTVTKNKNIILNFVSAALSNKLNIDCIVGKSNNGYTVKVFENIHYKFLKLSTKVEDSYLYITLRISDYNIEQITVAGEGDTYCINPYNQAIIEYIISILDNVNSNNNAKKLLKSKLEIDGVDKEKIYDIFANN